MERSRAATALDWLALALVVVAVVIAITGGTVLRVGGARLTARSPERALLAAIAVVALRTAIDRRTRPLANASAFAALPRKALCNQSPKIWNLLLFLKFVLSKRGDHHA